MNAVVTNIGWTDVARAASLAVRQAKAAARAAMRKYGKAIGWGKERAMIDADQQTYDAVHAAQRAFQAADAAEVAKQARADEFAAMREFFAKFPGAQL